MRLATDIDWREIDGEVVVLDRREGRYLAVNRSGTVLWPALVEGTTEEVLVERLAGRYSIERDRAVIDVRAFLDWLTGHGLLER
ncbi:MAG: PqqD family protein [Gaiellaceae bacterium]